MTRYRTLGDAFRGDVGRAIRIATAACLTLAITEYVSTVASYAGATDLIVKLRLAGVVLGLVALGWLAVLVATTLVVITPRLARHAFGGDALAGRGVLAWPAPPVGPRRGPARMWAGFVVGLVTAGVLQRWAFWVDAHYKERQLVAAMIAVVAVLALPVAVAGVRATARLFDWLAVEVEPVLGAWSPIGRWRAATLALAVLISAGLAVAWFAWPAGKSAWAAVPLEHFRGFPPWRTLLPLASLLGGGMAGSWWASRPRRHELTRVQAALAAAAALIMIPVALYRWGADLETKYVAVTASPALARAVDAIRWANDLDGDGFGSLMGENDCSPFDRAVHPGVRDLPDNGIDENCDGRDFSLRDLAKPPTGDALPVPAAFEKPWNVLLLTVDTVRYDHTSFGGYRDGPRHRDTTPRLAELVDRSTSFTFTSAPSAGTMASIPAILTSKFFHSGIALDEVDRKGKPPKLKPENMLIGELFKAAGYSTGAITSHEYFADWGMNQGMDSYDNEIGKDGDPFKITSSLITDRALAWVSRQQGHKWFLWAHYIDPHGRYVAHPDSVKYGDTEEDLYDGEVAYTDHHIGRLLDELARLPGAERTIVVITSDHGDGFNEHGFINHGQALYRELLHVPMIFFIPDNIPRKVGGAVTNLDIVPTLAELCRLDTKGLQFEGVSLVPQIFYGKEDPARIVFAETNFPTPIRAAVRQDQKLIYNLRNNIYELYDLKKDPWEKTNLWNKDPNQGSVLREALDRWLERVLYSRDPVFNQAAAKMQDMFVTGRPTPSVAPPGLAFDDGKLAILGIDYVEPTRPGTPGARTAIYIYYDVKATPSHSFRSQIVVWPVNRATFTPTGPATSAIRGPLRAPLDGLLNTDRWKPGEVIREKWEIDVQKDWTTDAMAIGFTYYDETKRVIVAGPHPAGDEGVITIGVLPLAR